MPMAPGAFAAAMTPCLTLVGGVGMDGSARTEWLHAAWIVLAEVPADLLKDGIREAMRSADHPSKIVKAVMDYAGPQWEQRKSAHARAEQSRIEHEGQLAELREYRARLEGPERRETTTEILARVWPTMHQHEVGYRPGKLYLDPNRPCRTPTREDYIRMGVDPSALDGL